MRMRDLGFSAVVVAALVVAVPAFAQQVAFDGRMVDANAVPNAPSIPSVVNPPGSDPQTYGTDSWVTWEAGGCDAMLRNGAWADNNCAYLQSTSASDLAVGYPIHIPTGAVAQYVRIYFNQTVIGNTISGGFWKTAYYGSMTDIATMSPTATTAGDTMQQWGPFTEVIDNSPSANTYSFLAITSGTTKIYKMMVYYKLQVSPAPGTATFTDVPTSYWAFQYVEALAASGITGGCGGGLYCPESPVTRAQMAVFLSKALGLHYVY